MKSNNSRVMHMAHALYRAKLEQSSSMIAYDPQLEWKNALKRAWYFIRFRKALTDGVMTFSFWKKDGTIREAKGTLHTILIPLEKMPRMDLQHEPVYTAMAFFDIEKQEWRSFSIAKFIGFVSAYKLVENNFNK